MPISFSPIKSLATFVLLAALSLVFSRCHKEKFITDSSAMVSFSTDTILFDTVFSTIGSTTQYMRVYNPHNETIVISNVRLESGSGSNYYYNIDGVDGPNAENIEILPNDSVWVFVEVTIDPGNVDIPFIVEDRLVFTTNGNEQAVVLNAWGRDAIFHGSLDYITDVSCNEVWTDEKPHVIYGITRVPEGCTLTINPGVEVYGHAKSGIWVEGGTLIAGGNVGDEPVIMQGDRLESEYATLPGQWGIQVDIPIESGSSSEVYNFVRGAIWIQSSPGSIIQNCEIKNANMGIWIDESGTPYDGNSFSVTIRNSKIYNMSGSGIYAQTATLRAINVLVANCAQTCAAFTLGGVYKCDNCTFANYWTGGARTAPAFALNNYYTNDNGATYFIFDFAHTEINNCIMFGNSAFLNDYSEFVIDLFDETEADQEYIFRSCLVDANVSVDDSEHFQNMVNNQGPYFCDPAAYNFRVSQNTSIMQGMFYASSPSEDILGNSWFGEYNKGCYKYSGSCE